MDVEFGYCHCGCGKKTNLARITSPYWGWTKGMPMRFLAGHGRAVKPVGSMEPPNPSGLCMCGCGNPAPLAVRTVVSLGLIGGQPVRYIRGHQMSLENKVPEPNPSGLCMCGCGEKTSFATITNTKTGAVRGKPMKFIHNHNFRRKDAQYLIEDRGYKTPCWIWQWYTDKNGYGHLTVDGRQQSAHRHYYVQAKGPIPEEYEVDHLCFVPSCVNPDHLEAVTQVENSRRRRFVRLTEDKIPTIIQIRKWGATYELIASLFGVKAVTIYAVCSGRIWKDIESTIEPRYFPPG
jgi:hypothetical protein